MAVIRIIEQLLLEKQQLREKTLITEDEITRVHYHYQGNFCICTLHGRKQNGEQYITAGASKRMPSDPESHYIGRAIAFSRALQNPQQPLKPSGEYHDPARIEHHDPTAGIREDVPRSYQTG